MVMRREWAADRVEELKRRWANGETCSEIARAMPGTTRCSVIGKVHRLALPIRPKRGHGGASRAPVKKPVLAVASQPVEAQSPLHIGIMDLSDRTCRFPFGIDPPFTYCGLAPKAGSPYCPACCAKAFQPSQPILRSRRDVAAAEHLTGINRIFG